MSIFLLYRNEVAFSTSIPQVNKFLKILKKRVSYLAFSVVI